MIKDKYIRRYIENNGETPDERYVIKDIGNGQEITRWEYSFPKPTTIDLTPISTVVDDEIQKEQDRWALSNTDKQMARATEDLIDLLVTKGVITLADLPQSVQDNLANRKTLRSNL